MGEANSPLTLNGWNYTNANPVNYTDPNGHCGPACIIAILIALGVISTTSGCSVGPEPAVCPALPSNLQLDALRDNPREQSLANIQDYFGIQLPPPVTYFDQSGVSHSTSYRFVYSSAYTVNSNTPFIALGSTRWFNDNLNLGRWGQILIFESAFQKYANAYDIADTMVHEAYHAWQQYTLVQLVQDPSSGFSQHKDNQAYYTKQWGDQYSNVMEYEASSFALGHSPKPLCTKQASQVEKDYLERNPPEPMIPGLEMSPWPMAGYPLP